MATRRQRTAKQAWLGGLTFVDYTFESCSGVSECAQRITMRVSGQCVRMTLKRRADTAAAAMVHRMMIRSRPRVFLLVFPRRKGSKGVETAMMARERTKTRRRGTKSMVNCSWSSSDSPHAQLKFTQRLQIICAKIDPCSRP